MSQTGAIVRKGRAWYLRYYDTVLVNGKPARKRCCRKLAAYCDRYRSIKSVRSLAAEFLEPLNAGKVRPESTTPVALFIEAEYLPWATRSKRPSTAKGYRDIWEDHVKARIGSTTLRDFRPTDGTHLLDSIAAHASLSRRTMYHIKSFLSGVFAQAISQGWIDSDNPMRNARIPTDLNSPVETAAYELAVIEQILALPELSATARLALAVAAFTGLRKGEIRGLTWLDYRQGELRVSRSVWHNHVTEPKTDRSKAPVPVVPRLATMLEAFRSHSGRSHDGYIFQTRSRSPLDLDNLARREIKPIFAVNQIPWFGWHAFRRGLATNLHSLGVDDKTIQGILRHSSLATTQAIYIKVVQSDVHAALNRLEAAMPSPVKAPN
jgi:integrase